MFIRIILSFAGILFYTTITSAQWVPLDPFALPGAAPKVELISSSPSGAVIKVHIPGFWINNILADGKTYQAINIGDEGLTTETGFPELPHIAKVLAIPDNGTISIDVIEKSRVQLIKNINVPPARESWEEGDPETPYVENTDFYSSSSIYPNDLARVEDPAVFRDFRIARVSVFPFRYLPQRNELEAYSSITVRVSYGGGTGINPKTTPLRPIAPSFAKIYRSFIFNYNEVLQQRYDGRENGYDVMLCIMPDNLYASFQPYADWKNKSGTFIIQKKFSEIGATSSNPTPVKDCILNYYTNSDTVPTHVLIVGDYGVAPIKKISYDYTFAYEDYFVELEGNDYFPEMMIGRFTNQDDYRLQVLVSKAMTYERYPYVAGGDWFINGIVCSNDEYESQVDVKRFTAGLMRDYGFINVDTMMSKTPCIYTQSHVMNALNSGRGYLNYRGEGWSTGWWAHCYDMTTSAVNTLNNGKKLTFVTSIGCGVAMFDVGSADNCFGEAWIELGTPAEHRGGVAFVGPTSNTHTTYNNKIDKGIYVGMFQESMDSPGEALLRGKLYMYNVYGNVTWVEYHYRVYCILGDPSLHVWKNIPKPIQVTHISTLPIGYSQVGITVKDSVTGQPVDSARVTISAIGVFAHGYTDSTGSVTLDVTTSVTGNLDVTVGGISAIPYEGVINVILGTQNITPNGLPVITDLDGNQDGLVNPNENCTIKFELKNWGTVASQNVYAKLWVTDTLNYVQMVTDSIFYGTINPNDSVSGTPFKFFVKPECPVGFNINFQLFVASGSNTWNYNQQVTVHGCKLEYSGFVIDDAGNILNNNRLDPGETAKVKLQIRNNGDDNAPDISGVLSSSDPFITILDSAGTFGSLLPDSSSLNEADFFVVKVSDICSTKYNAPFSIKLKTSNGLYPYSVTSNLIIPVAMPSAPDPTGPDPYGYYAYSSADNLWRQSPQYNWVEINGLGTEIPKPTGLNDFTETVNLPFGFNYYGVNQTQVRISSDGWIAFGSGTQTSFLNKVLPCNDTINNMTAVFWDDLFTNAPTTGKLLYYYDEPQHRFIIEWWDVPHFTSSDDKETFQIILFDPAYYPTPTGDGEIVFQYHNIVESGSCTIGIEDQSETRGLLYLFDETYDPTANPVGDMFAIKITTIEPLIVSVDDDENNPGIPSAYCLDQNYPNPFNPSTRISYSVPEAGAVTLKIYRIDGQLVKTIVNNYQPAGRYEAVWDSRNDAGDLVSSGVYFYRLQAGSFLAVKKMILLK